MTDENPVHENPDPQTPDPGSPESVAPKASQAGDAPQEGDAADPQGSRVVSTAWILQSLIPALNGILEAALMAVGEKHRAKAQIEATEATARALGDSVVVVEVVNRTQVRVSAAVLDAVVATDPEKPNEMMYGLVHRALETASSPTPCSEAAPTGCCSAQDG